MKTKFYVVASLKEDFDFDYEYANIEASHSIYYISGVTINKDVALRSLNILKDVNASSPAILVYEDLPIPEQLIH